MPRLPRVAALVVAVACLAVTCFGATRAGADPAPPASWPLRTGVLPAPVSGADAQTAMSRIAGLGTTVVLDLWWNQTVLPGAESALDFDPKDPSSPYYNWAAYDVQVQAAAANGLSVIGLILEAPTWALHPSPSGGDAILPDPQKLADFGVAAARRYSGAYSGPPPGLPRIGAWHVWNEPNISLYIKPQFVAGQPFSPGWYRTMLNTYYDAVKGVDATLTIVAGGTAPFFDNTSEVTAVDPQWGPLSFMRSLFCLDEALRPTCNTPVKLDVWAHHPYTEGSPTRRASLPDDVSLAEVPRLRAVLEAAKQAGNLTSSQPVQLWAPEFSWDSKPPDPLGVPEATLLRWVPESLHSMWQSGVSLVAWFTLYDQTPPDPHQSALWFENRTPKPHAQAFTFPLVGTSRRSQLEIWGRTPGGQPADVTIQRSDANGWVDLGTLTSDSNGIFQGRFAALPAGSIRAVAPSLGKTSAEYPLGADPEVNTMYTMFGGPPLQPPPTWTKPTIPQPPAGGNDKRIEVEQRLRQGMEP